DLHYAGYYVAGFSADSLFMGNYYSPLDMLTVSKNLSGSREIRLAISDTPKIKAIYVYVDSPSVYMHAGNPPMLLKSELPGFSLKRYFLKSKPFTAALPLSPSSNVTRSYVSEKKEYDLVKQVDGPGKPVPGNILKRQVDGFFCIDGSLNYNRKSSKLVYTYRYRNEFICMDTNLHVLYRGATIDTNRLAKIEVASSRQADGTFQSVRSGNSMIVNQYSCLSDRFIFIHSKLVGDNEYRPKFDISAAIDVYSLQNGHYITSFYLPALENNKLLGLEVANDLLFAVYDHNLLAVYKMNL
ncbi:MAG: hypothetical protein WCF67_22235, partial [Chitinophagaceae bacterium]